MLTNVLLFFSALLIGPISFVTVSSAELANTEADSSAFYFHHWDLHLDSSVKHATEGLWRSRRSEETDLEAELEKFSELDIIPQRWRGGRHAYRNGHDTPESLAEYWVAPVENGWEAIVIDEITNDTELRKIAGQALIRARELAPDLHIAVYVVPSIYGEELVNGLYKAADRILIEAYHKNSRYDYSRIEERYNSAIEHDLVDKSLIVLGVRKPWITSRRELRRQLHFTRYTFPEMPGIAVFGNTSEQMSEWLELELERFYSQPVLHVDELAHSKLNVTNIGGKPSPPAVVSLNARKPARESDEVIEIQPLQPGESFEIDPNNDVNAVATEFKENYTVLGKPLLWDREPSYLRFGADHTWTESVSSNVKSSQINEEDWSFSVPDNGENPESAALSIPSSKKEGFELKTRFEVMKMQQYGRIHLSLETEQGESSIELSLYRGDGENEGYWELTTTDEAGNICSEGVPVGTNKGDDLRLRLLYDAKVGFVRAAFYDESGENKLWDTGELPLSAPIQVDKIRFRVRDDGDSHKLKWNEETGGMQLQSSTAGSGGRLIMNVSDIEWAVLKK
ncbi:MAG: hypothetical protein ACOCZS_04335 [Verrucomicrobiota bacterium]